MTISAAPGAIPEQDFADDTLTATVADLQRCSAADIGSQGGLATPDGLLENNDFTVFANRVFASCGGEARSCVASCGS